MMVGGGGLKGGSLQGNTGRGRRAFSNWLLLSLLFLPTGCVTLKWQRAGSQGTCCSCGSCRRQAEAKELTDTSPLADKRDRSGTQVAAFVLATTERGNYLPNPVWVGWIQENCLQVIGEGRVGYVRDSGCSGRRNLQVQATPCDPGGPRVPERQAHNTPPLGLGCGAMAQGGACLAAAAAAEKNKGMRSPRRELLGTPEGAESGTEWGAVKWKS